MDLGKPGSIECALLKRFLGFSESLLNSSL